jgi:hypothetical protein
MSKFRKPQRQRISRHDRVMALLRARGPMDMDEAGRELGMAGILRVVIDLADQRAIFRSGNVISAARHYTPRGREAPVLALLILGDPSENDMAEAC